MNNYKMCPCEILVWRSVPEPEDGPLEHVRLDGWAAVTSGPRFRQFGVHCHVEYQPGDVAPCPVSQVFSGHGLKPRACSGLVAQFSSIY